MTLNNTIYFTKFEANGGKTWGILIHVTDAPFTRTFTRSNDGLNSKTSNGIYWLECYLCGLVYVGETKGRRNKRMCGHGWSNINHIVKYTICQHFNQPDHWIRSIQVLNHRKNIPHDYQCSSYNSLCRQKKNTTGIGKWELQHHIVALTKWMLYLYFTVLHEARWMWWTLSTLVSQIKMAFFLACNLVPLQSKHVQNFPIRNGTNTNARY